MQSVQFLDCFLCFVSTHGVLGFWGFGVLKFFGEFTKVHFKVKVGKFSKIKKSAKVAK